MIDETDRLRAALAQLASETRNRQGPGHPSPEELLAYSEGGLEPVAAEALLEHLAACRDCARLVLEIPSFIQSPSPLEPEAAADPHATSSWHAFHSRLGAPAEASGSSPAERAADQKAAAAEGARFARKPALVSARRGGRPGEHSRPRIRRAAPALAAVLAACLLGSAVWIATHGRSRIPPPIVSLHLAEHRRGGIAQRATVPVTPIRLDAEAVALVLDLPAPPRFARYRVEIQAANGATSTPAASSQIGPQSLLIVLTYRQLRPGDYRLRVFGIEAGRTEMIVEYPLRILPS